MAKVLKKIMYVNLICDNTGEAFGKCVIAAEIGSDDDASLSKTVVKEIELEGDDLTNAQDLFANCKAQLESDEGIS